MCVKCPRHWKTRQFSYGKKFLPHGDITPGDDEEVVFVQNKHVAPSNLPMVNNPMNVDKEDEAKLEAVIDETQSATDTGFVMVDEAPVLSEMEISSDEDSDDSDSNYSTESSSTSLFFFYFICGSIILITHHCIFYHA